MAHRARLTTMALTGLLLACVAAPAAARNAADPAQNHPEYWEVPGTTCSKVEMADGVQDFTMPPAAEGTIATLLVIKAGSGAAANDVVTDPQPGVVYVHSTGKDISHVITCYTADDDGGEIAE